MPNNLGAINKAEEGRNSSSDISDGNESDSDDLNGDEDYQGSIKNVRSARETTRNQREVRTRFVYQRKLHSHSRRSSRLTTLNERRSLAVYSNRKMHSDSDFMGNGNDSDGVYSKSRRNKRMHSNMTRIQRRTALSLRPISQKSYADPHSPLPFNSDSDEALNVRRSGRKRRGRCPTLSSWLADDQMHKVGYPNLNVGYSEEDSRDAINDDGNGGFESRRITRRAGGNKRREKQKFMYEYDTEDLPLVRRKQGRPPRSSNDKENKEENLINGNGNQEEDSKELENENEKEKISVDEQENNEDNEEEEKGNEAEDNNKKSSSDEEEEEEVLPRLRVRPRANNRMVNYRTRSTRKKNMSSSSESEEDERKGYSLRERAPKPAPTAMQSNILKSREIRSRRRFTRRRKDSSSSSSDTSSSQNRNRGKTPKSPHSKNEKMKSGAGGSNKIIPINPETLDQKIRFNSIGGLDGHIQCLKEMILLPMMYPEVFRQFQIQPPRGVLFHGPPGTGKTLIARALANECSLGVKKVSFFMRKGADLLSKWIGESEKQLRLLFEQAAEMKPSIIFFDELDGLAPVRSSRQDQVHASIVSTLLALMDGLDNRGEVIVIGATNRIDSIDPALRRPGRFDRELFFPLPSRKEREEILNVHVSQWAKKPSPQLISYLAEHSVGYCGSDLRALCSEAVIMSFRRTYPQVYSSEYRLLLNPENVVVEKVDFLRAKSLLVPASQRITQGLGRKLMPMLEPILQEPLDLALKYLKQTFPHGLNLSLAKVKLSPNVKPAQLLITANGSDHGQSTYLAPALLFKMEHIHAYLLDLATLYRETGRSPEEVCIQVFLEAKRNVPSIIYIPSLDKWWDLVSETTRTILLSQISQIDPNIPILFLATADSLFDELPVEIKRIFSSYREEVLELQPSDSKKLYNFFKPLIIDACLKPTRGERKRPTTPPPLPRAPTPPPTPMTEDQARKMYETEEHTLRELRIFLRDMCKKLANNKLFFMFTKPVDTEEVPDYTEIIKQPMDLETMMTKVDFHRYECAKDFLTDIELICQNALEYNPARTSADKQIRHRACSLRDYAYTLIKNEMDSDFEEKCQEISKKRRERKACITKYLPPYIITPENMNLNKVDDDKTDVNKAGATSNGTVDSSSTKTSNSQETAEEKTVVKEVVKRTSPTRKRKMSWQKGFVKKKKKIKFVESVMSPVREDVNESKGSSMDETKNNETSNDPSEISLKTSTETELTVNQNESDVKANQEVKVRPTTPLTVNCDTNIQSPKRKLSDLLSPSDLLDDPLDFDEIDQALEEEENLANESSAEMPDCPVETLEKVLKAIVKHTVGLPLTTLIDLYNNLNRIIKRYARTKVRHTLPRELVQELGRFFNAEFDLSNKL